MDILKVYNQDILGFDNNSYIVASMILHTYIYIYIYKVIRIYPEGPLRKTWVGCFKLRYCIYIYIIIIISCWQHGYP